MHHLSRIASAADIEPTEILAAVASLQFGLALGVPWLMRGGSLGVDLLETLAPLPIWAAFFLLHGALRLLAVERAWYRTRQVLAMLGCPVWLYLAFGTLQLGGPGAALYSTLALSSAWIWIRIQASHAIFAGGRRADG